MNYINDDYFLGHLLKQARKTKCNRVTVDILKNIAEVGHDNEKYTATDEVYEKLPSCCHYERESTILKKEISERENGPRTVKKRSVK